jgi:3-hydroxyisobutyrate dehydrogenase-like beta-hydroxyacid dehydrogenase
MPNTTFDKGTTRIGFIGLGLMGSRLARRLHTQGWTVGVWNRNPELAQALSTEGLKAAASIAELAAASDLLFSCLANDAAVEAVYLGEGGVFASATAKTVVVEMSTISAELSVRLHEAAAKRGVQLLDVPISGSTPAVDAGTITLLAGGEQKSFDRCVPVFESLAKQWFLMGPGSSGARMKLVVNLLLGANMHAIAEAISFGEHLRLEREVLLDVLSKTAVIAPAMVGKFQKIKANDYSPQFPLRLMTKDMNLVGDAAQAAGAQLPVAGAVQSTLNAALPASGDLDLSAITPFIAALKKS